MADFHRVMEVNVSGIFLCCKHAVGVMRSGGRAGGGGSIINLSSAAGLVGLPSLHAYRVSKGAVRLMSKSVAVECGRLKQGVRCNSIHPGLIKTDVGCLARRFRRSGRGRIGGGIGGRIHRRRAPGPHRWSSRHCRRRVYLASDAGRYVSGTELIIDGGYTAT
jgi:3alpha(or 20beta)-hydroxysteroid dehydrogenase